MNNFIGVSSLNRDISNEMHILENINTNEKEKEVFSDNNINLLCKGLNINNNKEENIVNVKFNETIYTVVLNGRIYNKEEIKKELNELGCEIHGDSDIEILANGFVHFGEDILKKVNGVFSFAIWNNNKKELFLARDQFGIKPLYYTVIEENIIFSTEVKEILKYPKVEAILDKQGISELFGLRTCSHTRNNSF